ncbi:hypothetical protein [Frankia sp. AgB32]|uniref:hypothetical protein n=1 Tax=Frankia sp. AgB32 TaxID=631119 RepID=UPI00200C384B|nr:hypothetical protein [Frankia sp. AgB32]MCK9893836.1 hypothetical protein [Frankia sp. AgB32]
MHDDRRVRADSVDLAVLAVGAGPAVVAEQEDVLRAGHPGWPGAVDGPAFPDDRAVEMPVGDPAQGADRENERGGQCTDDEGQALPGRAAPARLSRIEVRRQHMGRPAGGSSARRRPAARPRGPAV